MSATKPTILVLPGAWLNPSTYDAFISRLKHLSFPTAYASYPSLDPSNPATADAANDTVAVLEGSLLPLIADEGKDVVIVMHSYGGVPGSSAARGLSKAQRSQEGKSGGVVGLIHISGFVLPGGASVADGQGGKLPGWVKENEVRCSSIPAHRHLYFAPVSFTCWSVMTTHFYSLLPASRYPTIHSLSSRLTSIPSSLKKTQLSWFPMRY